MTEFRQEYELSIWEDVSSAEESGLGRFEERKIAVIGAHDLHTPTKAFNVTLKENVNGEKTLTFSIPRMYRDKSGELVDNPFLSLLTAERKLKFRDGEAYVCKETDINEIVGFQETEDDQNKWYDFVIKNIDEDRDKYVNNYTCKELFVNELGKNGWNIVLDEELMNNYGTLTELGKSVLEGSDWTIDASSFLPNEKVAEPLFIGEVNGLKAKDKDGNSVEISNATIYPFFSQLTYVQIDVNTGAWKVNPELNTFQFLYRPNGFSETDLDDNRTVIDDDSNYNYFAAPADLGDVDFVVTGGTGNIQTTAIQGNKLVSSIKSQYEPVSKKYVNLYTTNEDILVDGNVAVEANGGVYHYKESVYIAPEMVTNLIANATAFVTTTGWQTGDTLKDNIIPVTYPIYEPDPNASYEDFKPTNYLKFSKTIYNIGPDTNRIECKVNDKYVVRVQVCKADENGVIVPYDKDIQVNLVTDHYSANKVADSENPNYDDFYEVISNTGQWDSMTNSESTEVWRYAILTVNTTVSRSGDDVYLQVIPNDDTLYLQNIQLFPYIQIGEKAEDFLTPDSIPNAQLIYEDHYFYIDKGNNEVIALPNDAKLYTPISNGYTAVRNLSVKESNYFNNINSLAELFECWVAFRVKHCKNGNLLLTDGKPIKTVVFSQYSPTGKENSAGFRYGKNIKSIKRTVKSDTVASKLIVKNNNNEFATDGMASITRAIDNPIAENIVYNFDYYVAHGLLDATTLYQDLYGMSSNDFGYYRQIKAINDQLLPINEQIVANQHNLYSAEEWLNTYEMALQSALEEEEEAISNYNFIYELWKDNNAEDGTANNKITAAAQELSTAVARRIEFQAEIDHYSKMVDHYKAILANDEGGLSAQAKSLKSMKQDIDKQFYTKYARFIQEATWTDEKYVDDNLYYYDAKKVSAQNAWPKTSYTIGAIELSGSSKYAPYAFTIGDRSYIEDTEFFGYAYVLSPLDNNTLIKTPVHKEVVVSERSRNFDDPSKSTISIKTYKNQFEDLFSKITATTQSLQYSSGEYRRAANTVKADGSLNIESLESTFANNAFVLANATNQAVSWDSGSGIEVKNLANSAELVRIVSNGIMVSDNGGKKWTTGITARGINTNLLTAGTINANNINIFSGKSDNIFAFRWADTGISAIHPGEGGSHYVRFNELGLFGTQNGLSLDEELNKASTLSEKLALVNDRKYTTFALTWNGLKLAYQDGALSLEPSNGLEIFGDSKFTKDYLDKINVEKYNPLGTVYVTDDYVPLISLGRYKDVNKRDVYGLRMRNNLGEVTLDTNGSDGNLWLKNSLTLGTKQVMVEVEAEDGTQVQEYVYRGTAGISGKIGDSNGTNYAFWAGDEGSPNFSVTHEGILKAKGAMIEGQVTGEGLEIVDPKNNKAIAGINNSNFAFWSGPITNDDASTSYNFSVTKDGILNAQGANISGVINATSGSFEGEIRAKSGSIEKILFGNALQSYIGGADDTVLNINNKFKVNQDGNFYGEVLNLINYEGDQYRIVIGESGDSFVNINNNFKVAADGTVTLTGKLNTANGLKLTNGDLFIGEDITISKGSIYNNNGTWNINADGTAVFNNATINGILQSTVFEHSTSSAIAGDMWIAPAFFAKDVISRANEDDANKKDLLIPVPESNETVWEKVDSILIDNSTQPYPCSYSDGYLILTVSTATVIQVEGKQIISQSSKVNNIKISANDENGPYISMTYLQNDNSSKVVLGNLTQIRNNKYFGDLEGHGLYADNAYLTGKLYLPNAGITNEGSDSTSIRIWAGSTPDEMSKAPFRVLQDGSLYASKGIFSGQVNAEDSYFSGILSAAGVILKDENEDTPEKEHQRFFFHYLTNGNTKHIGAIESEGIKMWEGGLAAYTIPSPMRDDNGLQDLAKTATPVFETLNNDDTPRTYADRLQIGGNQSWTSALDGSGLVFKRLKGTDYANIKKSYDGDTEAAILKTDEGLDVKASIINLKGFGNSGDNATSIVKLTGTMEFNSTFEIETVEDGIVFNYIGD